MSRYTREGSCDRLKRLAYSPLSHQRFKSIKSPLTTKVVGTYARNSAFKKVIRLRPLSSWSRLLKTLDKAACDAWKELKSTIKHYLTFSAQVRNNTEGHYYQILFWNEFATNIKKTKDNVDCALDSFLVTMPPPQLNEFDITQPFQLHVFLLPIY